jgi:putative ABC transport system ATP-binding protein
VAVMGPSGSGKSSLLTIAGSLEEPTSGHVLIGGATLSKLSRAEKARLRRRTIGYVFQDFNLLPGLTAVENVSLPLELDGLTARKARAVGIQALDELELTEEAERFPDQLSGGERQRVAIARALAKEPSIILADEPTGNLDSKAGGEVIALLHELASEGATLALITHDDNIAGTFPRRLYMRDGEILKDEA